MANENSKQPLSELLLEVKSRMMDEMDEYAFTHNQDSLKAYKQVIAGICRMEFQSLSH